MKNDQKQLRIVVSYPTNEIQKHLRKLRSELSSLKEKGDLPGQKGVLGAIVMLEDMQKRGGRLEVYE